jgi:hypothetical protein
MVGYHGVEIGGIQKFYRSGSGATRSFDGLLQQAAIAALGHPLRACQMAFEAAPG